MQMTIHFRPSVSSAARALSARSEADRWSLSIASILKAKAMIDQIRPEDDHEPVHQALEADFLL